MDKQQWLNQVRAELARKKLPRHYVERLLSELTDHITDFMEDQMSTEAFDHFDAVRPMGAPSRLAVQAAAERRATTFCGRHPLVTLLALPTLMLPLLWIAFLFVALTTVGLIMKMAGIEQGDFGRLPGPVPAWQDLGMRVLFQCVVQIPIVVAAVTICYLAKRSALSTRWMLTACGLLALVASLACVELAMPTAESHGRLMFGLGLSQHPKPLQIGQFALPLVICGLALWRDASMRRRHSA